jgi:putative Ca2+/H+ antiporter (TMEM165/GDT1 family)
MIKIFKFIFILESKLEEEEGSKLSLTTQFVNVFSLVCIGEIGDRSQISIIYISNQAGFNIVLTAIVVANIILSILSVLCGKLLANSFSINKISIISGSCFIIMGFYALITEIIENSKLIKL